MGELRERLDREFEYIKILDPIFLAKGWKRLKGDSHWSKKEMSIFIFNDVLTFWHGSILNTNYLKCIHNRRIETDYIEFVKLNKR